MTLELRVREIVGGINGRPMSEVADTHLLNNYASSAQARGELQHDLEEAFQVPLHITTLIDGRTDVAGLIRLIRMCRGEE